MTTIEAALKSTAARERIAVTLELRITVNYGDSAPISKSKDKRTTVFQQIFPTVARPGQCPQFIWHIKHLVIKGIMFRLLPLALLIFLLPGCQKQTGYHSVDRWLVKDYQARIVLTQNLERSSSYCAFGAHCSTLCTTVPEPKIHWDQHIANVEKHEQLRERAMAAALLLKLPEPKGPVVAISAPPPIEDEAEISRIKLACLSDQRRLLENSEQILDKLEG